MFENIGDRVIEVAEEFGEAALLTISTFSNIFKGKINFHNLLTQLLKVGFDSLWVTIITSLAIGAVFALQIASEFIKFGAGNIVGGVIGIAVTRELAPALTGVVLAGRVGAAIAAEIGTMNVTEQIDAIRALGSDPIKYLVVPRFLACVIMLPILTIFAILIGFFGGYAVAVYLMGINSNGFMDSASQFMKLHDIFGGIDKAFFFGAIIAIVGCLKGLNAKGGAKGVGEATTSSVVTSLISIFIANYFLSLLLFK